MILYFFQTFRHARNPKKISFLSIDFFALYTHYWLNIENRDKKLFCLFLHNVSDSNIVSPSVHTKYFSSPPTPLFLSLSPCNTARSMQFCVYLKKKNTCKNSDLMNIQPCHQIVTTHFYVASEIINNEAYSAKDILSTISLCIASFHWRSKLIQLMAKNPSRYYTMQPSYLSYACFWLL